MEFKSLVLLDFDGVLNSQEACESFRASRQLQSNLVKSLSRTLVACDAGIVVSSTWRYDYSPAELVEILQSVGVDQVADRFLGTTRDLSRQGAHGLWQGVERGTEIRAWLVEHQWTKPFVVLDDEDGLDSVRDHVIKTSARVGLTSENADAAIANLLRQMETVN